MQRGDWITLPASSNKATARRFLSPILSNAETGLNTTCLVTVAAAALSPNAGSAKVRSDAIPPPANATETHVIAHLRASSAAQLPKLMSMPPERSETVADEP